MINKSLIDEIATKLKEAIHATKTHDKRYPAEQPYKYLMTMYYTHVESTGSRTIEQAVKDNYTCGSCRQNIRKYWELRLKQYGY